MSASSTRAGSTVSFLARARTAASAAGRAPGCRRERRSDRPSGRGREAACEPGRGRTSAVVAGGHEGDLGAELRVELTLVGGREVNRDPVVPPALGTSRRTHCGSGLTRARRRRPAGRPSGLPTRRATAAAGFVPARPSARPRLGNATPGPADSRARRTPTSPAPAGQRIGPIAVLLGRRRQVHSVRLLRDLEGAGPAVHGVEVAGHEHDLEDPVVLVRGTQAVEVGVDDRVRLIRELLASPNADRSAGVNWDQSPSRPAT